jgi:hypothetical protein
MEVKDLAGTGETGKMLVKEIGEVIKKPVDNLINPAAKTIGERIENIIDLIFTPIEIAKIYKNHAIVNLKNRLADKIKNIPQDKRITPALNIVGPVLEASKFYIEDDMLREMFANLVTAACNIDKVRYVAPAFPDVIRQLSPIDARMLKIISVKSRVGLIPMISCREFFQVSGNYFFRGYVRIPGDSEQATLGQLLSFAEESLSNFERLGLLKCSKTLAKGSNVFNQEYEWLEENVKVLPAYKEMQREQGYADIAEIVRESLSYTVFGLNFINACVKE